MLLSRAALRVRSASGSKPVRLFGKVRSYGVKAAGAVVPPSVPQFLGQVATRAVIPSDKTATAVQSMGRTVHVARDDITQLQVAYAGWYPDSNVSGQELASVGYTIKVAVEYAGAIVGNFLWGGAASGNVPAGGQLLSDVCVLSGTIPAGATFYLRAYATAAAAGIPYTTTGGTGTGIFGPGEVYESGAAVTDQTGVTGTWAGNSTTSNLYPVAIVAQTTKPSFFLPGDSRAQGSRGTPNANGDFGEAGISIGSKYPYIACGASGDTAFWFARYSAKRRALAQYCSHIIIGFPINDIRSGAKGRSGLQAESDISNLWNLFGGKPVIQLTTSPWSTSTDGFATVANQTTDSSNPQRVVYNDWLRSVPVPLAAMCDICSVMESSLNSGLWTAGYTGEGGHGNNTSYAALGASGVINADTLARTANVAQLWSPATLFPQGVALTDTAQWLSANDVTCQPVGTTIATCKNSEANWTQATAAKQPTLEANVINGRAAWRFTAANAQTMAGSTQTKKLSNGQNGALIALVIKTPAAWPGTIQQLILNSRNGSGNSNRYGLTIDGTGHVQTNIRRQEADTSATATGGTTLATSTPYIIIAQADIAGGTATVRINGTAETLTGTQVPAGTGPWPATDQAACHVSSNTTSLYYDGHIAELLQIPGVQTLADIQKIEGRLSAQYGIALAAGHPYAAGPPTV
jgi:hypothetical protein